MKKYLFLVLLLFVVKVSNAQQEKTISNTEIKNIRIYRSAAIVNRLVKTSVEQGTTKLFMEGLSSNINKQSLQVSGMGEIIILSVTHELDYLKNQKKSNEYIKVENYLDSLTYKLDQVLNLKFAYQEEQTMIISNKSIGGSNVGVTAKNIIDVADVFRNRLSEIRNKLSRLNPEEKKLREEIAKANEQLNNLNNKRNQPSSTITIAVSAKSRTNIALEVSYMVENAGWNPVYDIRSKDIKSPVQINYKANVYQTSGENWKDVKLTLSTGNPTQGGQKPTLYPWELDFLTPYPKLSYKRETRLRSAPQPSMQSMEMDAPAAMSIQAESISDYTTVTQNQLSTDFDITLPYSVPSDGRTYLVDVKNHEIPASYSYSAVPKIDKDAFLMAKITGWDALNLIPGPANIYFEGAFVGESYINTESTNDTLDLSLGRDKKITISREKQKDVTTNQLIGSNIVKTLSYETTVRNTKKEEVTIVLEDQVPVSRNKDIEVKILEMSGAEYNQTTGKITWKVTLAPSETQKRKLSISVKYPKDKIVPGL